MTAGRRPLDPAWWREVTAAFDALADLTPAERAERLGAIGGRDPELQREVEAWLASDADAERRITGLFSGASTGDPLGLANRSFSHFTINGVLGSGGMGVVYSATDQRLGRAVALKVPIAGQLLDPGSRLRFLQEARSAAALDHPAICTIHEVGESESGTPFIAMALYPGRTLAARLADEGALPMDDVLSIAVQVASGLAAAHAAGIVHRDLKPANVMLLPGGGVKILDFGLAKLADLTLTASSARLGTAAYMSPEQVSGGAIEGRSDLWSLGVVLFEMLSGKKPFGGSNEIGVAHAIVHDAPGRVGDLRDGVPIRLDALVRGLLQKDPATRIGAAAEVAEELTAIRSEPGVVTRPRRRALHTRAIRRRTAILAGAVLLTVMTAWLVRRNPGPSGRPVSLAVMPFEVDHDSSDTYPIATGLSDEIRTDLGRLAGMVVPGFTTMSKYGGDSIHLPRASAELRIRTALRGRVAREGERVRVDIVLLDMRDGRRLWSRTWNPSRDAMAETERAIVRAVAAEMGVRPTRAERTLLDRAGTPDPRAYEMYLRGRAIELSGTSRRSARVGADQIRLAQSHYIRSRDLDPGFAVTRARLALSHAAAGVYDTSEARREQVRLEAETALRILPGLAEAYEALAWYHDVRDDHPRALEAIDQAIRHAPNRTESRLLRGTILSHAGRLDDALHQYELAMQLDPGSSRAALLAGLLGRRLRRDEAAMLALDRVLALEPDFHDIRIVKGHGYLRWKGIPDTLAAAVRRVPSDWNPNGMATWARFSVLWTERRYPDALAMLDSSSSTLSRDGLVYHPTALMRARLLDWMGQPALARQNYRLARSMLADSAAADPSDPAVRAALGLANAGLGRKSEAVRDARQAMELVPVATNPVYASAIMGTAVEVYARIGEQNAALELLELLFAMPAGREVTAPFLRAWPGFDPLRSDPRFEPLLERFSAGTD